MNAVSWPGPVLALACSTATSSNVEVSESTGSSPSVENGHHVRVQSSVLGEGWRGGETMRIMGSPVCMGVAVSKPRRPVLELGVIDRLEVRASPTPGDVASSTKGGTWRPVELRQIRSEARTCEEGG